MAKFFSPKQAPAPVVESIDTETRDLPAIDALNRILPGNYNVDTPAGNAAAIGGGTDLSLIHI